MEFSESRSNNTMKTIKVLILVIASIVSFVFGAMTERGAL